MSSMWQDAFKKVSGVASDIQSTVDEYKGIGQSLKDKGEMITGKVTPRSGRSVSPARPTTPSADSGKRYGDKPGEKRLDSQGNEIPKYHKGTDYVPKTGPAILKKGEAVISAENNPMNAASAMAGITGKKATPAKKIKEIRTKKTDDGKYVHTHLHHHPSHHADETHVSNNIEDAQKHLADQAPNMEAQEPAMPEVPAPGGAAPGGEPAAA